MTLARFYSHAVGEAQLPVEGPGACAPGLGLVAGWEKLTRGQYWAALVKKGGVGWRRSAAGQGHSVLYRSDRGGRALVTTSGDQRYARRVP